MKRIARHHGFTLIEVMLVMAVVGIVAAMAMPMTASSMASYRFRSDAQALNNLVALAKMRASARFSLARVHVDLATRSFYMEIWDKTANAWVTEGPVTQMSPGVNFGFGALAAAPPNTQDAIALSPACTDNALADIPNTTCIVFNSRGIPISVTGPNAGGPFGANALYITNGSSVYATTVTATPLVRFWWSPAQTASWTHQ